MSPYAIICLCTVLGVFMFSIAVGFFSDSKHQVAYPVLMGLGVALIVFVMILYFSRIDMKNEIAKCQAFNEQYQVAIADERMGGKEKSSLIAMASETNDKIAKLKIYTEDKFFVAFYSRYVEDINNLQYIGID